LSVILSDLGLEATVFDRLKIFWRLCPPRECAETFWGDFFYKFQFCGFLVPF